MEDALDEAAVLAEHLEGEAAALEVVEDAGMVAADVHAAAERREVDVHRRFLGVAAKDYGVGLHVVLEILTLQLRETSLHVAAAHFLGIRAPIVGIGEINLGAIDSRERLALWTILRIIKFIFIVWAAIFLFFLSIYLLK